MQIAKCKLQIYPNSRMVRQFRSPRSQTPVWERASRNSVSTAMTTQPIRNGVSERAFPNRSLGTRKNGASRQFAIFIFQFSFFNLLFLFGVRPIHAEQPVEDVRVIRDVAYYEGADADPVKHKLDLYLPK